MKKIILLFTFFILTMSLFAQGGGFNYKAIMTDNGTVIANQSVKIRFTIEDESNNVYYSEEHSTTTDANGILIVNIGEGTLDGGNFSAIQWEDHTYFLYVDIDTGSGYEYFGNSEFKAVPYAKYAEKAGYIENPFWHQTSNATNSPYPVGIGEPTANEANLHINDVTGGLPLLKMTSDDNIYTVWQSDRPGVDDYMLGIDGGNNKFSFANITTLEYPLTLQGAKVGINNLNPNANLDVIGSIKYVDGNQAIGKVLTSDASGIATWQDVSGITSLNDLSDAILLSSIESIFIGNYAGNITPTGSSNNGLGRNALHNITSGSYNNAFGYASLGDNTVGNGNSGFGQWSLTANVDGAYNTSIGYASLYNHTSGHGNTALGSNAGFLNQTGTGNIFIGYAAGRNEMGSGKLYIENSDSSTPLIGGDFTTDIVTINGSLEVTGDVTGKIVSDVSGTADMKAYIYGAIGPDGVNVTSISSDGFTVSKTGTGTYRITSTSMNYYTVSATMRYGMIGFITIEKFANFFDVKTYDTAGVAADRGFDFVVFKK